MKKTICDTGCLILALALLMVTGSAIEGTMVLWAALPLGMVLFAGMAFLFEFAVTPARKPAPRSRKALVHTAGHRRTVLASAQGCRHLKAA